MVDLVDRSPTLSLAHNFIAIAISSIDCSLLLKLYYIISYYIALLPAIRTIVYKGLYYCLYILWSVLFVLYNYKLIDFVIAYHLLFVLFLTVWSVASVIRQIHSVSLFSTASTHRL